MRLSLIAAALGGATLMLAYGMGQGSKTSAAMIGTAPGGVGKSMGILEEARGRGHDLAMFGAGCFWGVESSFRAHDGVVATAVGYSGGHVEKPTYEQVCGKKTGHTEVVLVEFDPKKTSYAKLVEEFFAIHNPTQRNGQGLDIGPNYRSAIFTYGDEQAKTVKDIRDRLQSEKFKDREIATEITAAGPFWKAEDYHQQYYEKRGIAPACRVK